jgi:serine protease Do
MFASGVLALALASGAAAPAGAQQPPEPPQAPPAEMLPDEALPPILPAPDLPSEDPLMPPQDAAEAPVVVPVPGLPMTPEGTVFSFADLAEELLDSVVYISTSQRVSISRRPPVEDTPNDPPDEFFEDFFDDEDEDQGGDDGPSRMVQSLGSGFVIDASGLIVTNHHVIVDADEIVANFADGSQLTAEIVGVDDKTDLALLRVEPEAPLQAARFGPSEQLRVGDWVLAIGNPFGFGGTVTAGIVSALDRDINSGPYDHYIQTDASINRGNSGGPLFNVGGEVVGINTAIMSPTGGSIGIGFAVPTEIAVPVIEQLRDFGEVRRGWIGVRIQDVSEEFAAGLGMDAPGGALIAGLTEGGPADEAGIEEGDVIVEFDGRAVETMRALPRVVADVPPGETVDVVVLRGSERLTLSIEVGLLEDEAAAAATSTSEEEEPPAAETPGDAESLAAMFGLTLGPITEEARNTYSIGGDVEGVLVTGVAPGSEAEEKSVKPGDVIIQVSQQEVSDVDEVTALVEELKEQGRRTVMFLLSGAEDKLRFVSLRFEEAQ